MDSDSDFEIVPIHETEAPPMATKLSKGAPIRPKLFTSRNELIEMQACFEKQAAELEKWKEEVVRSDGSLNMLRMENRRMVAEQLRLVEENLALREDVYNHDAIVRGFQKQIWERDMELNSEKRAFEYMKEEYMKMYNDCFGYVHPDGSVEIMMLEEKKRRERGDTGRELDELKVEFEKCKLELKASQERVKELEEQQREQKKREEEQKEEEEKKETAPEEVPQRLLSPLPPLIIPELLPLTRDQIFLRCSPTPSPQEQEQMLHYPVGW